VEYKDVDCSSPALSFGHPFWQACVQLFENDWFKRVWTYQELILSRQVFVTLQTCVPWVLLRNWPKHMIDIHIPNLDTVDEGDATMRTKAKWFLDYKSKSRWQHTSLANLGPDPANIWMLFIITAQRHARRPKDHVFAILALMDDDIRSLVDVDYSKKDAQIFQCVFELALKTQTAAQTLPPVWEVLSWVPATTPGLPSWIPDLKNGANARLGQPDSHHCPKPSQTLCGMPLSCESCPRLE
jgi:hypothetical protein